MNAELKVMLEKLTTSELDEVLEVVGDLISNNTEEKEDDDGQPSEEKEQSDFAQDDMIPYDPE